MKLNENLLKRINHLTSDDFVPFYIYDEAKIREICRSLIEIEYPNKSIHFATMANVNETFLKIVKSESIDVFVNSILHLEIALNSGFKRNQIVFTSSSLDKKVMEIIGEYGIQLNVDSMNQLELWTKLFPGKPVGIRCNIGDKITPYSNHAGVFIGSESRLGFTYDEILSILDKTLINGLHLYSGTDIFDINYLISCYLELFELTNIFPNLEYVDLGGGFGVSENGEQHFDFKRYGTKVTQLMNNTSKAYGQDLKLVLEPGRIIGAESGHFVCRVNDVKLREKRRFVGLNACTSQFPRPMLYPDSASHPLVVIRNGEILNSDKTYLTSINGCSTYSRDFFAKNVQAPEIHIGDIIVFGNAGSYCTASYTEFLGFSKPLEYFV